MIVHWTVPIAGVDPRHVKSAYIHAVVTSWPGHEPDKPWSITPIIDVDGVHAIHVITLSESAGETASGLSLAAKELRLGSQTGHFLGDPVAIEAVTFADMLDTDPQSAHCVAFLTPTTLRSGTRTSPFLDPVRLARSTVTRWNKLVPAAATLVADDARDTWVSDIDGHNEVTSLHKTTVSGFVGRMRFVHPTEQSAQLFSRLWTFAEHAGIGAYTAAGLGRICLEQTWQPTQHR